MVSDSIVQVYELRTPDKRGDGISSTLYISPRYLDEPPFTLDQEKAFHEMARAFIIANRKKEAAKRARERQKAKREEKRQEEKEVM